MAQTTEDMLTESALNRLANDSDPRFKQVITALIKHVHAFAREVEKGVRGSVQNYAIFSPRCAAVRIFAKNVGNAPILAKNEFTASASSAFSRITQVSMF